MYVLARRLQIAKSTYLVIKERFFAIEGLFPFMFRIALLQAGYR